MREAIAAKLEPGPAPFGRSAASASLPSYALYGEHGQTKAIDWMHCERIAERSQRHDWEIRPHRHASLFQILHIERGAAQAWLEAGNQALVGPCVLLVPALVPHGFVFAPDIEGTVITLLEQHLLRLLQRAPALADRLVQTRWLAWPAADPQGQALHDAVVRLREAFAQAAPWRDLALDAALLLQGMVDGGRDYAAESATTGPVRIGMPKTHYFSDINPEIGTAIEAAVAALGDLSARRVQVEVPAHLDTTAFRADIWAYHRDHVRRSPELYHPDTLARIKSGAEVDKGAQRNARAVLDGLRATAGKIFDQVDVLVTPTSGVPPFGVMRDWSPEQLRAVELFTLRNTRPFNALGLPAMSVPCGFTSEGLPIGMQIVGPPGGEARVLAVARAFQQRTDWHKRRPPV